ncbi:MAG: discoidin domain-containing protein [Bacteroidales bacterium]|nr:discoidin domain-containing protein [Bacteroidales bacterium]
MFNKPNFRQRLVSLLCLLIATFAGGMAYAQNGFTYTFISGTAGFNTSEGPASAIDGTTSTKWCSNATGGWELVFKTSRPVAVCGYSITTGNDNASDGCRGRNPQSWVLYGSNDESDTKLWTVIDEVVDDQVLQDVNYKKYDFTCAISPQYQYFKLYISKSESSNIMQLSEFSLTEPDCLHEADGVSTWTLTSTVAPTCTEAGYDLYTCSLCGGEKHDNPSAALGHDAVLHPDNGEATCAKPHHDDYYECSRCGKLFSDAACTQEIGKPTYTYKYDFVTTVEGESSYTDYWPFVASFRHSTSLAYYTADEVQHTGELKGLQYKVAEGSATLTGNKVWIYLATVPAGSKAKPALDDLTLVYQGEDVSVGGAAGWQPWAFNVANYNYDGSGDLLVVMCRQNNSYKTNVQYHCIYKKSRVDYRRSDNDSSYGVYSLDVSYSEVSYLPFTKFNWNSGHVLKQQHDYDCLAGGHEDWYECTNCHQLKTTFTPYTDDDIIAAPIERAAVGHHTDADKDEYCDVCGSFFHDLVHHPATVTPPTCTHPGHGELWECATCGKLFSDAAGEQEIEEDPYTYAYPVETALESESSINSSNPFIAAYRHSTSLTYYTADEVQCTGVLRGL